MAKGSRSDADGTFTSPLPDVSCPGAAARGLRT